MNNVIEEPTAGTGARKALWTGDYIALTLSNLFSAFSFSIISTIMSKYLTQIGVRLAVAGLVVGLISVTSLLVRPISGFLSDRYDKKIILLAANLCIGASVLGYTASDAVAAIGFFRILHGAAFCVSGTACIALASETIPNERQGEGLGYISLGQVLAIAVAPGLGILLIDRISYAACCVASSVLAALSALVLLGFQKHGRPAQKRPARTAELALSNIIDRDAIPYSVISGTMSMINGIINAFIILYFDQIRLGSAGLYFIVSGAAMFVIRPLSGKLLDQKGLSVIAYPAFCIGIAAMILHGCANALWVLILAAALKSIATASVQASMQAQCVKQAPPDRKGVASSTYFIGSDIGQGLGPMIGGVIIGWFGYGMLFGFCAAVSLTGMILFRMAALRGRVKAV